MTAESLSDPELGYTVASIPEGLDGTQTKVLQDYIAYDKATWRLWFTNEGVDEMHSYATGDALERITANAEKRSGRHANPPVRIAVSEVTVEPSGVAKVRACLDQSEVTETDDQGKDVTKKENQARFPVTIKLVNGSGGSWLANEEDTGEANSCSL
ncbi:hypothetical protein [Actinomyces sp. ZJ308]|uniref:hypothetical protein n=1 Tax=Actinomyces sp. ZJ308 TaxID=2708342 RepID=UPI001FB93117|nr:hypothetical protein [Actinomyces sp. ZJ308]